MVDCARRWGRLRRRCRTAWRFVLHDYQKARVDDLHPPRGSDALGKGWNITQAKIAIGSGGVAGKGFTCGEPRAG